MWHEFSTHVKYRISILKGPTDKITLSTNQNFVHLSSVFANIARRYESYFAILFTQLAHIKALVSGCFDGSELLRWAAFISQ